MSETNIVKKDENQINLTWRQQVEKYLKTEDFKKKLISIFGSEKEYEKQINSTLLYLVNDKNLQKVKPDQIFKIALQSYEMDIPLNSDRFCYVIGYGDSLQIIPTAKGYIRKVKKNPNILDVRCYIVYEGDFFDFGDNNEKGSWYEFKPNVFSENYGQLDKIKGGFVVIDFKDGKKKIEVMSLSQLKKVRSKAKTDNVYKDFAEEMYKKIIIKRGLKNESIPEIIDIDKVEENLYSFEDEKPTANDLKDIFVKEAEISTSEPIVQKISTQEAPQASVKIEEKEEDLEM